MMKNKFVKVVLAAVCAFALCVSLAACSSPSSTSASGGASPAASPAASSSEPAKVDPAAEFVGTWKLAAINYQNLIAVGDFDSEMFTGNEMGGYKLTVDADGTGSFSMGDESQTFKWEPQGDTVAITWDNADTVDTTAFEFNFNASEGVVEFKVPDDETDDVGAVFFTKDGKYGDYEALDLASTTPITDTNAAVGTWKIVGLGAMGMTMYGTAEDLAAAMGDASAVMELKADGTGSFAQDGSSDESFTWKASADGAQIEMDMMGTPIACPITAHGDEIVLDMTPLMGGAMQMYFIFAK